MRNPLSVLAVALTTLVIGTAVTTAGASRVSGAEPVRPGALAFGHGVLYIADEGRQQILAMSPSGQFRIVAGTGRAGYSSDGGPALRAELNDPAGMAVLADGTLLFADQSNNRIRAIKPDGTIRTIAGDGRFGWVRSGTPARRADLGGPTGLTVGPDGLVYIAAGGANEILRLNRDATLTRISGSRRYGGVHGVGGPALHASPCGPSGLAFDGRGDMYIAGFATKALLMIDRKGFMREPGGSKGGFYPRGVGGIVSGSSGRVFAMDSQRVVTLTPSGERTVVDFARRVSAIRSFLPNGIAAARGGSIYVDTDLGNGWATRSVIAVIRPNRSIHVLWRGS